MPSKYRPNCHGCILSKTNKPFRDAVYHAVFYREPGDATLQDIAEAAHISKSGLYNHSKKHMTERQKRPEAAQLRLEKKSLDLKAQVAKKHELAIDHDDIIPETQAAEALKEYITQGHAMVKEGKINITAQSFLQAIRIDLDYQSKKKDREVDIIKTMYRFASGHTKEVNVDTHNSSGTPGTVEGKETTYGSPAGDDSGEDGSSLVHHEDARDALTRWAAGVPETNAEVEDPYQLTDMLEPLG